MPNQSSTRVSRQYIRSLLSLAIQYCKTTSSAHSLFYVGVGSREEQLEANYGGNTSDSCFLPSNYVADAGRAELLDTGILATIFRRAMDAECALTNQAMSLIIASVMSWACGSSRAGVPRAGSRRGAILLMLCLLAEMVCPLLCNTQYASCVVM